MLEVMPQDEKGPQCRAWADLEACLRVYGFYIPGSPDPHRIYMRPCRYYAHVPMNRDYAHVPMNRGDDRRAARVLSAGEARAFRVTEPLLIKEGR